MSVLSEDEILNQLVDRFLGYRLPHDFNPDNHIHFESDMIADNRMWPIGTNLLTAAQAKEMFKYVLGDLITRQTEAAVNNARAKDPHKCKYGHEVYSHKTADGWCCACDTDQVFMNGEIEKQTQIAAESNFESKSYKELYDNLIQWLIKHPNDSLMYFIEHHVSSFAYEKRVKSLKNMSLKINE